MLKKEIELIIENSIDMFQKVLNVNVWWDFASSVNEDAKHVTATYVDEEKLIIVNPNIDKCFPPVDDDTLTGFIIGIIAHECYHAFQYLHGKITKISLAHKNDMHAYLMQKHEIEAYSFQTLVLSILFGKAISINLKDQEVTEAINKELPSLYKKWKNKIMEELK